MPKKLYTPEEIIHYLRTVERVWRLQFSQVLWTADQRFRKPFSRPYSSLLRLTRAHSSQGLREIRTLAGIGWNELE